MKFYFLIVLSLLGCATTPTQKEFETADYGPYPEKYEQIIKAFYSEKLFDPYSAAYNFSSPVKGWDRVKGKDVFGWTACAKINAKNRMGGYVGVRPFFFLIKNDQIISHFEIDPLGFDAVCSGVKGLLINNP